jgi:hypothetical protein
MTPRWTPTHRKVRDEWGTRQFFSPETSNNLCLFLGSYLGALLKECEQICVDYVFLG